MIRAIVGANWGDEGKGKITDMFAADADIVIRFQGGANAGHTIINDRGKFALHQLPSGVFYTHTTNVIGNGVALNVPKFVAELESIQKAGFSPNVMISDRTQIVMPYHLLFDQYEEERLAGNQFGSTKSGIAPFYSDKYAKIGIQVADLFNEERLRDKLSTILEVKNLILKHIYGKPELNMEEIFTELIAARHSLAPYVSNTFEFLYEAVKSGKNILLEGQLGSLKDPEFGIYPFTTSSHTLAAFGAIGAGIPPHEIRNITAVVKAYSSAVGAGPFVSELFGTEAEEMRQRGGDAGEYGATTGRPRRMGWFDAVATRYGCRVQGATEVALTVLDALGYLDEIKICVGYEIDGKVIDYFPTNDQLERAKPILETLPGWKTDIKGIRHFEELPKACQDYVTFIEKKLEIPITIVTNGPRREDVIFR